MKNLLYIYFFTVIPYVLIGQNSSKLYVGAFLGHGRSYSSLIYYNETGSFLGGIQGIWYIKKKMGLGLGYEHSYHDIEHHELYPELNEAQAQSIELSVYRHFKDANQEGFYTQFSVYPSLNRTMVYVVDSTLQPYGYYTYNYRTQTKTYPFRIPVGISVGYNMELSKRRISFALFARQDIQKIMLYNVFLGVRIGMYWKLKA